MGEVVAMRRRMRFLGGILILTTFLLCAACSQAQSSPTELLLGIEPQYIPQLEAPDSITPQRTGIAALDALNEKWGVQAMEAVYPDLSPDDEAAQEHGLAGVYKLTVPANTDVEAMIAEYVADQHVQYLEVNAAVEIN
ncbi:MAG: hypothetical protein ACOC8X_11610 [Chloroflexota bacterium]